MRFDYILLTAGKPGHQTSAELLAECEELGLEKDAFRIRRLCTDGIRYANDDFDVLASAASSISRVRTGQP